MKWSCLANKTRKTNVILKTIKSKEDSVYRSSKTKNI